ncbi:MAG: transglutaminase family protein [Solirubrobacteraceae bacterium]|nr:transglutaminase family protein [Patulibacter sp.]
MNYDIHYLTHYRYDGTVTDNLNSLRVRPANTSTQRCDEFHLRLDPEARITRHIDYFGTEVLEFGVSRPHDHLTIDVRARVATSDPAPPPEGQHLALSGDDYLDVAGEFLLPMPNDPLSPIDELVAATTGPTPLATLNNVCQILPDRFAYQPGATYVGSTVDDFLAGGAGVCQDFAHLSLVVLRRHGIAARYVSGYFFSTRGAIDGADDSVEVQTHAWVEALLPGDSVEDPPVWVGADPTNRTLATEAYVKIGHGRGYADVPPTKGVYFGSAHGALEVSVTMTRVGAATTARA